MSHYAAVLLRDLGRLKAAYDCVDQNPLGGGAISGTSFPTDRMLTTELLGFQKVRTHSLDATGNRDWMCEVRRRRPDPPPPSRARTLRQ